MEAMMERLDKMEEANAELVRMNAELQRLEDAYRQKKREKDRARKRCGRQTQSRTRNQEASSRSVATLDYEPEYRRWKEATKEGKHHKVRETESYGLEDSRYLKKYGVRPRTALERFTFGGMKKDERRAAKPATTNVKEIPKSAPEISRRGGKPADTARAPSVVYQGTDVDCIPRLASMGLCGVHGGFVVGSSYMERCLHMGYLKSPSYKSVSMIYIWVN